MPVLTARGLGLRTRRGWVFRDVDLDVEPGELVALTGPSGSGRTSLLLALAGHFRTTAGTRRLAGRAGIGLVPRINEPEPGLTAAEQVRERELLLGRSARWPVPVDPATLGRDLTPYQPALELLFPRPAQRFAPRALVALAQRLEVPHRGR